MRFVTRTARAGLVALALLAPAALSATAAAAAQTGGDGAAPLAALVATYQAAPPASMTAGASVPVPVTLMNAGDEAWTAAGATPVNLSYHWYDTSNNVVVWNGARASLGADVAVGASRTLTIQVTAPADGGPHILRFALVKEGVAWVAPGPAHPVSVVTAFQAAFGAVAAPPFVATGSYLINVPITNVGASAWTAAGPSPVTVSYHWHDDKGRTVVWDGERTSLPGDVAPSAARPAVPAPPSVAPSPSPSPAGLPASSAPPAASPAPSTGASVTVALRVIAPERPGAYTLTIDLVREGVGWFASLGATVPLKIVASVAAPLLSVEYAVAPTASTFINDSASLSVTVRNTGNLPIATGGAQPVNLAYHLLDDAGRTLLWDGPRTSLGADLAPGASRTVTLKYVAPAEPGTYLLALDLVREGVAWFSSLGVDAARIPLTVTSGFAAGYGASTTPAQATIGSTLRLTVQLTNYGPRTWPAGGPTPVRLSYHLFGKGGATVAWEGNRGVLPGDVPTGGTVTVPVDVALPQTVGAYTLSWDLVQEGVAWFSGFGIARKDESVTVQPGVTFYGSGFGHGVGMSQYGAQGYATGAAGPPLSGEQIILKYFPGTQLMNVDASRGALRALLSAPSSRSGLTCGMPYFDGTLANVASAGGFRVLNEGAANAEVGRAAANVTWQIAARAGMLQVWNQATVTKVYEGSGPIVLVPIDPLHPLRWQEKGSYRGNLKFTNNGGPLRVVNYVSHDDYVRGVVPREMPTGWHIEAYKAQAYAARTYGYTKYAGGGRDYDVTDDQGDQCYGGTAAETGPTDQAAALTAGKVITYDGAAIRSYFSSSNGGYTLSDGCWAGNVRVAATITCGAGQPYLVASPDPADLAVSVPSANRNRAWSATFTSDQIRDAVRRYRNVDIGELRAVDLSNRVPADVGHVVSVRIQGSAATVDVPADAFLRTYLGLKSTMVRLSPF